MLYCVQLTGRTKEPLPVSAPIFFSRPCRCQIQAVVVGRKSSLKSLFGYNGQVGFYFHFQMIVIIVLRLFDRLIHCLVT